MKAYCLTTGVVFGLVVAAHAARLVDEGSKLVTDPLFIVTTLLATGLCAWGLWLFGRKTGR